MSRKATNTARKTGKKAATPTKPSGKTPQKRAIRPMADVPQIGAMTPEDFESAASEALGGRGWQKAFVQGTGIAQSTLTRYLRGIFPIPQWCAIVVEMLQSLRNNGLTVPDAFSVPQKSPVTPGRRKPLE